MKLLDQNPDLLVTIEYFGTSLEIPGNCDFVACDEDGSVWAFTQEPGPDMGAWWVGSDGFNVGHVDLEGMDWRETLRQV